MKMMRNNTGRLFKPPLDTQKKQTTNPIRCPHCCAENHAVPASMRERVADVACGLALLAVLLPIGYFASQWAEQKLSNFTTHQIWLEPLR